MMRRRDLLPIRGSGGGSSGGDNSFHEDADSLITTQFAEIVDLVGEGPIAGWTHGDAGRDTYLDSTPVKNADGSLNFSEVEIISMWGGLKQEPPSGFRPPSAEQVVGIEVRADRPVVREIADPRITGVRITVSVGQLSKQDGNSLGGTIVKFAIDMSVQEGAWRELALDAFNGKTMSGYAKSYRIPTDGEGPWRFRVRRITEDSTSSLIADKIYWSTVSTLIERRFSYPLSCVIFTRVKAKEFTNIPSRQFDLKLLLVQVPQNYDPETRAYAATGPGTTAGGLWDGSFKTAWTDNPAWVWYDLATNPRYGLGQYLASATVDRFELYQIAKYCDELVPNGFGGTEPRFTFNYYFRERQDAIKTLVQLAGAFRSMSFFASGTVFLSQDVPRVPVRSFTAANVENGQFQYVGTARTARHTVALVKWSDPTNQFRDEVEYVQLPEAIRRFGINEIEIEAVGCTSRGQAHRMGLHVLLSEWNASEVVSFSTGMDSLGVMPGDVIATQDPGRTGDRRGGRLRASSASQLQLDAPVTLQAGSNYEVSVTLPDLTIETRAVLWGGQTAETDTLNLVEPLSQVPVHMAVWLLASDDLPNECWRVLGLAESDGKMQVSALAYNPDIFAAIDTDTVLAPRVVSTQRVLPGAITELKGVTSLIVYNGVTYGVRVALSWKGGRSTSRYAYRYRVPGGNWEAGSTSMPGLDIDNVPNGTLEVEITPLNMLGLSGPTAVLSYEVLNDTDIGAVIGLRVAGGGTEFSTADAQIEWDELDGADYYEVRILEAQATTVIYETTVTDTAFTFALALNRATGGPRRSFRVGVRAVRPDGRSQAESTITVSNPAPAAPTLAVEPGYQSVSVSALQPYPVDVRGFDVWISDSPIAEDTSDAPVYSGVGMHYARYGLSAGYQHYVRARLRDDLGIGAMSSQVTFLPLAAGGVPLVEDPTTVTATPGSPPPAGDAYWAVYSQADGRMYRWDAAAGRYTAAVSADDIEGKIGDANLPSSVQQGLSDLATGLQEQGQQLAAEIRQAMEDAEQLVFQEQQWRESATQAIAQDVTGLKADLGGMSDAIAGQASAIDALQTSVQDQGGQITAQATQLTQLGARVGSGDPSNTLVDPAFAGDLSIDWGASRTGMAVISRDQPGVPVGAPAERIAQIWQRDTYGGRVVPCRSGDRFYVSGVIACLVGEVAPDARVGVHFYDPDGQRHEWLGYSHIWSGEPGWNPSGGEVEAPWDGYAQFWFQIAGSPADMTPANASWLLALPELHTASAAAAMVDVERQARVDAVSAVAQQVEQVSAELDGVGQAVVQVEQQAQATANGIAGSWGVRLDAGGYVSGLSNFNNGQISQFRVAADQVAITPSNAVLDPDFSEPAKYWPPQEEAWVVIERQPNGIQGAVRQLNLWGGRFNGTNRVHAVSAMARCPFAPGEAVRLRAVGQVTDTNQQMHVAVWFYGSDDASGPTLLDLALADWVSGEYGAKTAVATIPSGVTHFRIMVFNQPTGAPFAGDMRVASISLTRAVGADMVVDGAITARAISADAIDAVSVLAANAVFDYAAVNSLSALSANLGNIATANIVLRGQSGWQGLRTDGKWWGDNVPGFVFSRDASTGHFIFEVAGPAGMPRLRMSSKDGCDIIFPKFSLDQAGNANFGGNVTSQASITGANGYFGTITAGYFQNAGGRNFIDLNATGSAPVIYIRDTAWNEKARINADGTYKFAQVVAAGTTPVSGYADQPSDGSSAGVGTVLSALVDTGFLVQGEQMFGLVVTALSGTTRVFDGTSYGEGLCNVQAIVRAGSTGGVLRTTGGGRNAQVPFYTELAQTYRFYVDIVCPDNWKARAMSVWLTGISWQLIRIT
ncbi:MAG: phage tail protein [Rhodocyclaceae bacterium]